MPVKKETQYHAWYWIVVILVMLLIQAVFASYTQIATTAAYAAKNPAASAAQLPYVGYAKAGNFASPGGAVEGVAKLYRAAPTLRLNHWGFAGVWNVAGEFATLNEASGSISLRFHARDLHLVLGPSSQGQPVRFRVKLDGVFPGADHGVDVDAEGWGRVQEPRLYQLVRQARPGADRTFEIEFLDPGVRAYVFTFG